MPKIATSEMRVYLNCHEVSPQTLTKFKYRSGEK